MQIQNISLRNYLVAWSFFWVGLFGVLNPAATNDLNFIEAMLTWVFNICVPLIMLTVLQIHFQKLTLFNKINPWIKIFWVCLVTTFVFTPFAIVFDMLLVNDRPDFIFPDNFWNLFIKEFKAIFFPLTLCWFIMNAPFLLNLNFNSLSEDNVDLNQFSKLKKNLEFQKSILSRIPIHMGNDIIYIASELHYTRVITTKGKVLILYNFSDAISDIEHSIDGVQIHRSYWVAKKHILKLINQELILSNGERLPVSRRKIANLKKNLAMH